MPAAPAAGTGVGRTALRDTLRVDLAMVAPVTGAITAVPVVALFAVGLALQQPAEAVAVAVGANLLAVASLVAAPRLSLRLAATDAVALGVAVAAGSLAAPLRPVYDVVLVAACFAAGMLVVFGQTQATVGTQVVIALLVLGHLPATPTQALQRGALVSLGAMVEIAALLVLRLPPTLRVQRARLADSLAAVGDLARRAPSATTVDAALTMDAAAATLASPSLLGRTDVADLRAALDQARRMRLELMTLAGLRTRLGAWADLDALLGDVATVVDLLAEALRHPRRPVDMAPDLAALRRAREGLADGVDATRDPALGAQSVRHVAALTGQLRATAALVERIRGRGEGRAWRLPSPTWQRPVRVDVTGDLALLRANLTPRSTAFRHAVRLAVAVPAAAVLADLLGLPRSYWLPFSVVVILRPDYSTLFGRGLGRVVGTLVGAAAAAAVVAGLHPGPAGTVVAVGLCAWAAYSFWAASFAVAMGFITALVLLLLSTTVTGTWTTAADRVLDVTLGALIAVVAYRVWPSSTLADARAAQGALLDALRAYLLGVTAPSSPGEGDLASLSRATRVAWTTAEAAVRRAAQEPRRDADQPDGAGMLAAAQRVVRATHALRSPGEVTPPVAAAAQRVGVQIAAGLSVTADTLTGGPPSRLPDLRAALAEESAVLAGPSAPPALWAHLDELVDAVDTAAHLAGLAVGAPDEPGLGTP